MNEELEVIVQKMLDAGEPEDNIKLVIEEFNKNKKPLQNNNTESEPTVVESEVAVEEEVAPSSEQNLTDKQKDISQYTNRLVEVSNLKFNDEERNAALKIAEEDGYADFLKQARQNLEALNETITPASLKEKAIELSVLSQEDAWQQEQADEILEEFETEFGIDRVGSVGDVLETVWNMSLPGTLFNNAMGVKKLFDASVEEADKFEEDPFGYTATLYSAATRGARGEEYLENRQELYRQLDVKDKESKKLEKEYSDKVNNILLRKDDYEKSVETLKEYEDRIKNKDPNFTSEEYEKYKTLFNSVQDQRKLLNADIENLGEAPIPSNDLNTIKNLTLKTYDNISMIENNVGSSVVNVVAGVAKLKQKLELPELLKWTGIDLANEESLNDVFGEGDSIFKDAARFYGKSSEGIDDLIDASFEMGNAIKGLNAPVPSITEVDSVGDFGMYMMDLASGQAVNTALTIAVPPAGLAILSAQAAGGKMYEMDKEIAGIKGSDGEWIVPPKDISAAQYYSTAALYGGVEYATERVSLGILKGGFKNVKKAFDLTGNVGPNLTLKNLTTPETWAKFGYDFTKDSFKEGGAEGIVQLTSNLADMYILGNEDVSIMDGMTEAMAAGFFMGNMYQAPNLTAAVTQSFSSEGELAQANKINAQLLKLSEQRDQLLKLKGPSATTNKLQTQIEKLLDKQMEAMNVVQQRTLDMTPADRQGMIDQYNYEHQLRAEIDAINADPDLAPETKAELINDQAQLLAESESIRERIIADATFNKDIERTAKLAQQIRSETGTLEQVETVVAEDADNALQQGLDYIDGLDYNDQQKNALKQNLEAEFNDMRQKSSDGERYHGFAWGDNIEIETQKDGEMVKETINVPMTFALDKANMTVQSHELGHHTLFKSFMKNNPDAVGLVDDLEAYVKKNYKEAYERFNKVREAYRGEDLTREQMAEEQLAHLSDFMRQNNLQGDRTLHNKLFGRFQKVNDGKNQIETGKDVFDMITSYNQSFETGELQGLAKSVLKGEAVVKRKAQQARDVRAKEQIADIDASLKAETQKPKGKFSKFIQGETAAERSKRQTQRNVDVADVYKQDAEGKDNEGWKDFLDSPKGQRVMGELVNKYYPDMIATAIRQKAESPMDAASEALIPLMQHIQAFNPSKNKDLAGYIGGYLGLKVGTGIKRVAKKAPTVSMEKEGVRQVAEKQAVKEETKEQAPVREGIKIRKRLGKEAQKVVDVVKSKLPTDKTKQQEFIKEKTYKSLKDLAPEETQLMFGIKPKPGNLTKQDIKNAQMFIAKDPDLFISLLPNQHTTKRVNVGTAANPKYETRPDTATGVQNVLLQAFYTKGKRKDNLTPWTKKKNISKADFLKVFGITQKGEQNLYKKESNTSARIKALVEQTGRLITNQTIREMMPTPAPVAEGKSRVMFAKDITKPKTKGVKENIKYIQEKAGIKPLEVKGEGRIESIDYLMNDFFPKLINEFGDAAYLLLKSSTISPAGNEAISFNKDGSIKKTGGAIGRDQLFINSIIRTIKSKAETQKLLDEGKLGQLQDVLNLIKNVDVTTNTNLEKIKTATLPQKTPNIERNIKSRKQHKEGSEAIIDSLKNMYNADNNSLAGIAFMLYNANANSAFYRNLAQLIGIEEGSGKNNAREEHMFQAGPWAQRTLEAITKPKKIFDAYNKWQAENYYQETITKDSERLVDGKYKLNDGTFWNAKSQEHPYMKEQMDIAMKSGDFSKVPSPDIRKYNEFFNLNPNNIIREGISDAKRYNVEVSQNLKNNKDVIALQSKLIFQQLKGDIDSKTAKQMLKIGLPIAIQQSKQATPANETVINNSGVMKSKDLSNSETIRQANILDKALNIARDPNAPVKKIRVFDFDDTLARTKSNVLYTMPDGTSGKLTAEQFAVKGTEMLEQGAEFDFSEFNKVMDGKKGPLFEVAEMIADKRGTQDMFVLTARSAEAAPAIKEFLDSIGLNIPIQNITGLGDSSPLAKSGWIVEKAADGYNDFYFADDALKNVKAVKKVLDVIDVKSKVQQAKIKFSKDIDTIFNDIIENKTGIASEKEYSKAKAEVSGANKGKFKFWIAPSAEDFVGLLYPLLGKGKLGDSQMAFFKKHLLDPYGRAMENISREQNRLSNDFKALKKALVDSGSIPKKLRKKAVGNFTYENVARILAWNKQGMDIPGLSKSDLTEILKFAEQNPGIDQFAEQLIAINKGDGYMAPKNDWLGGTITTDLLDGLRTGKRTKYLQEWQDNIDLIFSEKNLNKLEAAYGPKYREALQDMIRRMRTGKNRTTTGNRLENRLLDYINNSVGTVMFLNMRSGVLQLISAANFINWGSNNPFKAGLAFANQPQYWKDFMRLMNSDFLVDRRNGLKINVSESEIADAAKESSNKARGVISYLLKKGFTITQIMDSFAIASGGATFYRNKIKELKKQEYSDADAETKAYLEFRDLAEESQQSSRPDRISQQQASNLGRVILAFANTPMQYNRIMKKAFLDLKNGRGDWKGNISKILYYGAIQNAIFVGMQQAMFALMFDDEEEPEKDNQKKYYRMANSMADNILRGLGIWGAGASTLMAVIRKVVEQSKREGSWPPPDYDEAAWEFLNFSPPIDIKMSKLRQAANIWKYEGWKHDEARFGLEDPAYESAASVISALTNLPADRFYRKVDNILSALDSEQETWKRIANLLGYPSWQLETTKEQKDRLKDEKQRKKDIKAKKKEEAQIKKEKEMSAEEKEKLKEEKRRKKYKDLNKAEQVSKLDSLGLSKAEIRALKYEKDRVNKLLELMEE